MTSFAFIFGVVPLVLSSGSGAHGRILLGVTVIGGMIAASFIAIFLIPVSFYVVERLIHGHEDPPDQDPEGQEIEDSELLENEEVLVSAQTKQARTQFKIQGGH